jgi:hypothetical protein
LNVIAHNLRWLLHLLHLLLLVVVRSSNNGLLVLLVALLEVILLIGRVFILLWLDFDRLSVELLELLLVLLLLHLLLNVHCARWILVHHLWLIVHVHHVLLLLLLRVDGLRLDVQETLILHVGHALLLQQGLILGGVWLELVHLLLLSTWKLSSSHGSIDLSELVLNLLRLSG